MRVVRRARRLASGSCGSPAPRRASGSRAPAHLARVSPNEGWGLPIIPQQGVSAIGERERDCAYAYDRERPKHVPGYARATRCAAHAIGVVWNDVLQC